MPKNTADQFSDDEMHQLKRYGQALGGKPTPFDEEFEEHYARHEANAAKTKPGIPADAADNQQGDFDQRSEEQDQAIANPVDYGNAPVIGKAPQKAGPPNASNLSSGA
jgi:hypothetical protein